jgi:hypothetical protein
MFSVYALQEAANQVSRSLKARVADVVEVRAAA